MAQQSDAPVVIKKYANRRLYNTRTSTYVTLEDLSQMVKDGVDFVVVDAKTSEDITRNVLTQIIFDAENKGPNLLPITFLRQLIRFYGDSMERLVPPYLDHSLAALAKEQEKFRSYVNSSIGAAALEAMEEQARRNMEMFQRSIRMFMPFKPADSNHADDRPADTADPPGRASRQPARPSAEELDEMRAQLRAMQARIDQLVAERDAGAGNGPDEPCATTGEADEPGEARGARASGRGAASSPRRSKRSAARD